MLPQTLFGDQPHDVLRGAADEVLAVLKNENLKVRSTMLWALDRLEVAQWRRRFDPRGHANASLVDRLLSCAGAIAHDGGNASRGHDKCQSAPSAEPS